jgi:hypothetical protein
MLAFPVQARFNVQRRPFYLRLLQQANDGLRRPFMSGQMELRDILRPNL